MSIATAPEQHGDEHTVDAADPRHGTDLDPCATCAPATFDRAVLAISTSVRTATEETP